MLHKIRVGRKDFFFTFFYYPLSIQGAYGTLKQNLVKFQYTEAISITLNGTEDANI